MQEEHFTVATPDDFALAIETILNRATQPTDTASLITLSGDLGAGKTTFTQQLAKTLGVVEPVVSPTFGIMKGYDQFMNIVLDEAIEIRQNNNNGQ